MFKDMFKRADILLAVLMLLLCVASFHIASAAGHAGTGVTITANSKLYGTYSLLENREITVEEGGNVNVIRIENGSASMTYASCNNQVCIHQGSISLGNQSIVCLPNRVIVTVEGAGNNVPDAVSY